MRYSGILSVITTLVDESAMYPYGRAIEARPLLLYAICGIILECPLLGSHFDIDDTVRVGVRQYF